MFVWRGRGFLRDLKYQVSPVEFLILLTLLEKPKHGYDIMKELEEKFEGVWIPKSGTLYPSLSRLEEKGYVKSILKGNRKLYMLTSKGSEIIREIAKVFDKEAEFLDRFIQMANSSFLEEFTSKHVKRLIEKMLIKAFKILDVAMEKIELLDLDDQLEKLHHVKQMLEDRIREVDKSINDVKTSVEKRRKRMVKIKIE